MAHTHIPDASLTPAPFETLPDEILDEVFHYLDTHTLLAATRLSKRVKAVIDRSLAWRSLAQSDFRYWDPSHDLRAKLAGPAASTDWHGLVKARRLREKHFIATNFERALSSPVGRMANLEAVANCGYDARDYLLRQLGCPADADDYLARTFWATRALGHIDRREAIRELAAINTADQVPPERILACLDLCALEPSPLSLDEVSARFDRIAADFRSRHLDLISDWTPRQLAYNIVGYLYEHNLVGARDHESYHDMQNSFITVALLEHDHPSMMLLSCAILCAVATRLGLNTSMTNFPAEVHALVSAPAGITLDGLPSTGRDRPYSNPDFHVYVSLMPPTASDANFVSYSHLHQRLRDSRRFYNTTEQPPDIYLSPTSAEQVILRSTMNLTNSREFRSVFHARALEQPTTHYFSDNELQWPIRPLDISPKPVNPAVTLIRLLLRRNFTFIDQLPRFLQLADPASFLDYSAVESLLLPLLPHNESPDSPALTQYMLGSSQDTEQRVRDGIAEARAANALFPLPLRRGLPGTRDARHRVGTYFQHAKYAYMGIIVGWDRRCEAPDLWIAQMRVNDLPGGSAQVFYNVVDEQGNMRYVAEENIAAQGVGAGGPPVGNAGPHEGVMRCAGQWFKRWDAVAERFVSNLDEEYPDD